MKISELIARLRDAEAAHGDVDVLCWAENPSSWTARPVQYLTPRRGNAAHGPITQIVIEDEDGGSD